MSGQGDTSQGAYGFRLTGLPDGSGHLHPVPAAWPELRIVVEQGVPPEPRPPGTIRTGADDAELWLAEAGRAHLTREPLVVRFTTPAPLTPDAVLHPFLALPAAIASRWLGRAALHASAFAHANRAYALLGPRLAGKSSTLAALLQRGTAALSDDIVVLDGEGLYAGPRSIDLRAEPAAAIGGQALGRVGNRERWRLRPEAAAAYLPIGGFILLDWGAPARLEPLSTEERLHALVAAFALRPGEAQAGLLLELAARPAWRFVRPRDLARLAEARDQLLAGLPG